MLLVNWKSSNFVSVAEQMIRINGIFMSQIAWNWCRKIWRKYQNWRILYRRLNKALMNYFHIRQYLVDRVCSLSFNGRLQYYGVLAVIKLKTFAFIWHWFPIIVWAFGEKQQDFLVKRFCTVVNCVIIEEWNVIIILSF